MVGVHSIATQYNSGKIAVMTYRDALECMYTNLSKLEDLVDDEANRI